MVVLCLMLPIVAQDIVEVWPSKLTVKRRTRRKTNSQNHWGHFRSDISIYSPRSASAIEERKKSHRETVSVAIYRPELFLSLTTRSSFDIYRWTTLTWDMSLLFGPCWPSVERWKHDITSVTCVWLSIFLSLSFSPTHTNIQSSSYDIDTLRGFYLSCPSRRFS